MKIKNIIYKLIKYYSGWIAALYMICLPMIPFVYFILRLDLSIGLLGLLYHIFVSFIIFLAIYGIGRYLDEKDLFL